MTASPPFPTSLSQLFTRQSVPVPGRDEAWRVEAFFRAPTESGQKSVVFSRFGVKGLHVSDAWLSIAVSTTAATSVLVGISCWLPCHSAFSQLIGRTA